MSIPALMGSVSERSAASFRTEVNEFENELADWLARYERVRRAKAQGFAAIARVEEEGDAAADHVRLRLRFPAGFELPPDERYAGQPPSRPRFERFPTARFDPSLLSSLSNVGPLGSALPPSAAKVWRDRDALIVELGVGRINQSDYDDTDQFSLVAPAKPGNYEVGWELTADGLRRPSRGTLILGVKEPNAGSQCLATLDDARAECERLELD